MPGSLNVPPPRWMRRRWLLDSRGRPYRAPMARGVRALAFRVLYQQHEGGLWQPLTQPNGAPLLLALDATRPEFLAIATRAGSYQLIPIDERGDQRGDPPQRLDIGATGEIAPPPSPEPPKRRPRRRTRPPT